MTIIKLIQRSKYRWELVGPKGHTIQEGLYFGTLDQAETYVKNYVTSFQNWSYEVVKL